MPIQSMVSVPYKILKLHINNYDCMFASETSCTAHKLFGMTSKRALVLWQPTSIATSYNYRSRIMLLQSIHVDVHVRADMHLSSPQAYVLHTWPSLSLIYKPANIILGVIYIQSSQNLSIYSRSQKKVSVLLSSTG